MTPLTLGHFRHLAESLVAEKDVVELLSAALAVVSGNADIKQRSLLSSREVLTYLSFPCLPPAGSPVDRPTSCLDNLEMSANLTVVGENLGPVVPSTG